MNETYEPHIQVGCCTVRLGKQLPEDHIYHKLANEDDAILSYEEENVGACDIVLNRMDGTHYAVNFYRSTEADLSWIHFLCADLIKEVSRHNEAEKYITACEEFFPGLSDSLDPIWEKYQEND